MVQILVQLNFPCLHKREYVASVVLEFQKATMKTNWVTVLLCLEGLYCPCDLRLQGRQTFLSVLMGTLMGSGEYRHMPLYPAHGAV